MVQHAFELFCVLASISATPCPDSVNLSSSATLIGSINIPNASAAFSIAGKEQRLGGARLAYLVESTPKSYSLLNLMHQAPLYKHRCYHGLQESEENAVIQGSITFAAL